MNTFKVAVVANQPFYEQMKVLEIAHLKNFSKQQFDELAKFNPQIVFIGILDPELIKKIRTQINPINIIGLTYEHKISNWLAGGVDECLVMPVSSSEITNNLVVWGRITNSLNQSQLAAIKLVENLMAKETKTNQPVDKLQPAAKSIDEKPKIKQVVHQPTEQQPEVKPKIEKPTEVIYPDPEVNKSIEQSEKPTINKQPDKQLQQSDKQPLKEAVEPPAKGPDKQLEDELLSGLNDKTVEPDTELKSVEKSPEKESEDQTDNQIKDPAENQEPVQKPVAENPQQLEVKPKIEQPVEKPLENDDSDNHSVENADSSEKAENNDNVEKKDDNSQSEDNSNDKDDDIDLNDYSAFERIMNETKTGELSLDEDEKIEEDELADDDHNSDNSDVAADEPQKQETVDEANQNVEADDQKANSQNQATSPTSEKEVVDQQPADDSGKQPVRDDNSQTVDDNQPQAPESDSSAKPANDQSDDFMSKLNSLLVGLNGDDQPKSKKQPADKVTTKAPVDADPVASQPKHKVIDPNEPKHHIVTSAEQKEAMKRQALDNAQNHILTDIDIKALLKAYPDDAPKIKQVHEYIQRQQDEKRKEIIALNRLQREPIPKIIAKQKTKKQDPLDQLRNLKLKSVNNSNDVADNQPKVASKPQETSASTKPKTSASVKEPTKTPEEAKTPEVQKPATPNPIETKPAQTPVDQPVESKPVEHPQTLLHFNEGNKSQTEVQQSQPPVTQPKPSVQAQSTVQQTQQPQQPQQPVQQPSQSQPPVEKPKVKENVQPQAPQQPVLNHDEKDKVKILSPNADLPDLGNVQNNENQYQQLLKQQQKAAQKDADNVDQSNETIPNADLDVDPTKGNNTNVKESATLEVDHPNNKKKKKHHLGLGKLFGLRKKS